MNHLNLFILRRRVKIGDLADGDTWADFGITMLYILGLAMVIVVVALVWHFMRKSKQNKLKAQAGEALGKAAAKDAAWNESNMIELAKDLAVKLESARETGNWDVMGQQVSYECIQQFQVERMKEPHYLPYNFKTYEIIQVTDYVDDSKDSFSILMAGTRHYHDEKSGFANKNYPLEQVWTFNRNGDSWLLGSVRTTNVSMKEMNEMTSTSEE